MRKPKRRRHGAPIVVLLLLALAVCAGAIWLRKTQEEAPPAPSAPVAAEKPKDDGPDYDRLETLLSACDGDYVPPQELLSDVQEKMAHYPQYEKSFRFFLRHIRCFSDFDLQTLLLSPEKVDFLIQTPAADKLCPDWNGVLSAPPDTVPLFLQYDPRWGLRRYGSGCMGNTACGPVCLSMAAVRLTGDGTMTPPYVAAFAEQNGYYTEGAGTSWALFTEGAEKLGLRCSEIGPDRGLLQTHLDAGDVLIASMRKGDFTFSGHFIVLRAFDGENVWVNDPSSAEKSALPWPYEQILPQIAGLWAFRAA